MRGNCLTAALGLGQRIIECHTGKHAPCKIAFNRVREDQSGLIQPPLRKVG
jgi:hypothetical protein